MGDLMSRSCKQAWSIARLLVLLVLLPSSSYAAGFDIVRDGTPTTEIVIPDTPVDCVRRAAEELQYYVKEASGATLEIVSESDGHRTGQGRIYLGACEATKQAGVSTDTLTRNGFIIRVVGSDLFLAGRDTVYAWTAHDSPAETGTLLAVYNLLDRHMGVRWLWPGRLGDVVPKAPTIRIGTLDRTVALALRSSRFHPSYRHQVAGWSSDAARRDFAHAESLWEQRHCFSWDASMRSEHSFGKYWERFGATHPEYFNMLPDGTRRSDPHYVGGGNPMYVSMCVSEPRLWQQIVDDWKASRTKLSPHLFCGENDTQGRCCCPRCMSWDVPDPELDIPWDKRLEYAKRDFAETSDGWYANLGSLADRYARFYMEVLKLARQTDPNVLVTGYSYANYANPPLQTTLDDHVVIHCVGDLMYPWTPQKIQKTMDSWVGWANTGATVMWRPNFMLDGHNMPVFFARKLGNLFSYLYQHGMTGTAFDSNIGQYATQGPNMYVLARMHSAANMPVDEILDEYYGAFGPAEAAVREYFNHWEKVSDAVTDPMLASYAAQQNTPEGGYYGHFYAIAAAVFTPDVMAKGHAILQRAADSARGDITASARVEFLKKGLKNAELTLAVQDAYRMSKTSGSTSAYQTAITALDDYRLSVEANYIGNMAFLYSKESRSWDRTCVQFSRSPGIALDTNWTFMWDPKNEGLAQEWFSERHNDSAWFDIGTDGPWEQQSVGKQWKQQHGTDYDGFGWYRNRAVVVPPSDTPRKIILAFGAVDEACRIWVNGRSVLDRPYPYKGNSDSWMQPFAIDITEHIRYDRPNVLAVRVEDSTGAGGIWRPVKLLISEGE